MKRGADAFLIFVALPLVEQLAVESDPPELFAFLRLPVFAFLHQLVAARLALVIFVFSSALLLFSSHRPFFSTRLVFFLLQFFLISLLPS